LKNVSNQTAGLPLTFVIFCSFNVVHQLFGDPYIQYFFFRVQQKN